LKRFTRFSMLWRMRRTLGNQEVELNALFIRFFLGFFFFFCLHFHSFLFFFFFED
jgi:hypothetical protein